MASLPTRLKVNIRDHITDPEAALPKAAAKVSSILGYPIVYDPEWAILWTELQPQYPDQSTFVPSVASVLIAWCETFTTWLEGDDNETDAELLLEALSSKRVLKLVLDVEQKATRPVTSWNEREKVFIVALPKAKPSSSQTVSAGFASDFLGLFSIQTNRATGKPAPDDWSMLDSPVVAPVGRSTRSAPVLDPEGMPDLAMLERPEELLKSPPYRMVVSQQGIGRVEVQGSHHGSLVLLEAYLKKWVRHSTAQVTKHPLLDIKLRESLFGLGLLYDSLLIEASAQRGTAVNASLVLAFIENVLGYELMSGRGVSGAIWEFERKRAFK